MNITQLAISALNYAETLLRAGQQPDYGAVVLLASKAPGVQLLPLASSFPAKATQRILRGGIQLIDAQQEQVPAAEPAPTVSVLQQFVERWGGVTVSQLGRLAIATNNLGTATGATVDDALMRLDLLMQAHAKHNSN